MRFMARLKVPLVAINCRSVMGSRTRLWQDLEADAKVVLVIIAWWGVGERF